MIETKLILIDGQHLSKLMVEHNVGVSTVSQYELKKLDTDYFDMSKFLLNGAVVSSFTAFL